MAAISLKNDSMIFASRDQSCSSRSVLNPSVAPLCVLPLSVESSTTTTFEVEESEKPLNYCQADGARRRYSFHKSEMRKVFDRFDENSDGLISREELRRWCIKTCCDKELSGTDVDSMISSVDRNNDGAVDFEEFLSLYETRSSPIEDQEKQDENIQAAGHEEDDLMLQAFRVFDRNHDGFISADELQAVLINLRMPEGQNLISCENMIRHVDRNDDGQCDLREFREMMSALPQ